ncbi:MAG: hypothetical protein NVSMB39_4320 [Candidatus Saccharimonadales bacterium]
MHTTNPTPRLRSKFRLRMMAPLAALAMFVTIGGFALYQSHHKAPAGAATQAKLAPYSLGFAPYAYVPYGEVSMDTALSATGVKQYVVAFMTSPGTCTPVWDNNATLDLNSSRSAAVLNDINAVRAAGGDVTMSFGGEGAQELATYCSSVSSLQAAYRSVITTFNLTRIDLDIEGTNATDTTTNLRRAQALAALQAETPDLKIYLTIASDANGITSTDQTQITQMRDSGAALAGVNIMTMYFGTGVDDAQATLSAAQAAFNNLKQIYPTNTDAEIWASIDITNNIGVANAGEVFTTAQATTVRNWAGTHGIGMLSFWNVNRDHPCGSGGASGSNCSGTSQTDYQFMRIMNMPPTAIGTGGSTPAPTIASTPKPTTAPTPAPGNAIPGDLNSDGKVNVIDLSILLSHWAP